MHSVSLGFVNSINIINNQQQHASAVLRSDGERPYHVEELEPVADSSITTSSFAHDLLVIFANNTEFAAYGYEAAFYITEKFGVSAAYASAFSGRIIFASPSYSVGLFLDLK